LRPFGVQHVSNKRLRTAVDNSLCVGPTFGRRPARHKRADRQRCRAVRNRDKEVRVNEKPTLASPSWRAFSASYRMRASRKQSPRRPGNLCDLSKWYFAMTFLSSSLTCPATQSALCGSYTAPQKIHDVLHG